MSATIPIIIQARMGSARLPGKVLARCQRQPLLLWPLARLTTMLPVLHPIVVATSTAPEDRTQLAPLLRQHGYTVQSPEVPVDDVLARYLAVAESFEAEAIVRLTGDCPVLDPGVVTACLQLYYSTGVEYVALAPEWADGLDVEVIRMTALRAAAAEATVPSDREHVTPYIWQQPGRFSQRVLPCPFDLSAHCWSVDDTRDLLNVDRLLHLTLHRAGLRFTWWDVWQQLEEEYTLWDWATSRQRNAAYMQQRAQEQGQETPQAWQDYRYGASGATCTGA